MKTASSGCSLDSLRFSSTQLARERRPDVHEDSAYETFAGEGSVVRSSHLVRLSSVFSGIMERLTEHIKQQYCNSNIVPLIDDGFAVPLLDDDRAKPFHEG